MVVPLILSQSKDMGRLSPKSLPPLILSQSKDVGGLGRGCYEYSCRFMAKSGSLRRGLVAPLRRLQPVLFLLPLVPHHHHDAGRHDAHHVAHHPQQQAAQLLVGNGVRRLSGMGWGNSP